MGFLFCPSLFYPAENTTLYSVYHDYMVRYPGDNARRKKRDFLNNVIAILDAMKDKDYFDDYKQTPRSTDIIFSLERK